jgi:hypothetical protein
MQFFHIEDVTLKRELWDSLAKMQTGEFQAVTQKLSRAARAKITVAERRLLELLVFDGELRDTIIPLLEPSDYENLATAEMFHAFIAIHNERKQIGPETLMNHLGDDEAMLDMAHNLLIGPPQRSDGDKIDEVLNEAENCVFSLRSMAIANRITEISREAAAAEQRGDSARAKELTFEQLELEKIRRSLQR